MSQIIALMRVWDLSDLEKQRADSMLSILL
jgi:hypothetical protein